MKLKRLWKKVQDALTIIEILRFLNNLLFPPGGITIIAVAIAIGGGKMLPSINSWLRDFISVHWIWFYAFTVFSISVFVFGIRLIIKTQNEMKVKRKQTLDAEREYIKEKILIVPRPEIFYHYVYLNVINLSIFDIKIGCMKIAINGVSFQPNFFDVDQKVIRSLSSKQIEILPINIPAPKSFVLNPKQIVERKITGTMFFYVENEEFSIPINSNLIWRDIYATP
jgi:hypothetical protein